MACVCPNCIVKAYPRTRDTHFVRSMSATSSFTHASDRYCLYYKIQFVAERSEAGTNDVLVGLALIYWEIF